MREKTATGPWLGMGLSGDTENALKENVDEASEDRDDELASLKASLAQREAACLRIEGENFILKTQVEQLQQNAQDVTKDVQSCQAYLAQAHQLLDCVVNGRMLHRTDVEPVRAIIAAARRSAKRAAHGWEGRPAPEAKPKAWASPRGERPKPPARRSVSRLHSAGTGGTGSSEAEVHLPPSPSKLSPRPQSPRPGATKASDENAPQGKEKPSELQMKFAKQRMLLVAAMRRGAEAEEKVTTMKDDLTRRDVIIHNLKQDQLNMQQEMQNQQQLFESQLQLLQQQHQAQQMQQVQQYHDLETLLHAHMTRQPQEEEPLVPEPIER